MAPLSLTSASLQDPLNHPALTTSSPASHATPQMGPKPPHSRLGEFGLLQVVLRLLVRHAHMAAQRQQSPVAWETGSPHTVSWPLASTPWARLLSSPSPRRQFVSLALASWVSVPISLSQSLSDSCLSLLLCLCVSLSVSIFSCPRLSLILCLSLSLTAQLSLCLCRFLALRQSLPHNPRLSLPSSSPAVRSRRLLPSTVLT